MDIVLQGDEYDDRNGMNDKYDAADAGDDHPGGGRCCCRRRAGSSRRSQLSTGATCRFEYSCRRPTPSAMSGGGGCGRGL